MKAILVVDDEAAIKRVIKLGLERAGYTVELAGNGEEALKKLEEQSFAAMVTDICMPRMGGQQLCETVRQRFAGRDMAIFVTTSKPESDYRTWARQLGDVEFLEKPLSVRHLVSRMGARLVDQPGNEGDPA